MDIITSPSSTTIPCSTEGTQGLVELRRFFTARMANRHALTMPERRASFAGLMTSLFPRSETTSLRFVTCADRPAEVHEPKDAPIVATMLYLHGGAYVSGGSATHRHFAATLSHMAHARIVMLDYRLAPEHPYPAAIEDTIAAFIELKSDAGALPVMLGGDSAGGGLTLAVAQTLRDKGGPMPEALVLLSPFVDLTLSSASYQRLASKDPFLTTAGLTADVARYVPDAARRTEACASPLFGDLAGLPDTMLQVGSDEILLDECVGLLTKLQTSGVPVTAELWDGMVHNWHLFPNWLPEADRATAHLAAFIQTHAIDPERRTQNSPQP